MERERRRLTNDEERSGGEDGVLATEALDGGAADEAADGGVERHQAGDPRRLAGVGRRHRRRRRRRGGLVGHRRQRRRRVRRRVAADQAGRGQRRRRRRLRPQPRPTAASPADADAADRRRRSFLQKENHQPTCENLTTTNRCLEKKETEALPGFYLVLPQKWRSHGQKMGCSSFLSDCRPFR